LKANGKGEVHGKMRVVGEFRAADFFGGLFDVSVCGSLTWGILVGAHDEEMRVFRADLRS
jgi:hypothetical protein